MKSLLKEIIILAAIVLLFLGCDVVETEEITGSGNLITLEKNQSDFTEVKTGFAFESTITNATGFKVSVTLDDNLEKYLKVYKLGNVLYVQMEDNNYIDAELKVDITMPDVEKIDLSGASVGQISGFNLDHDVEIVLSGASNLSGSFNVENLITTISGASNLTLSGNGNDLSINGSGASVIDLGNFRLRGNADILLSGASVSTINVNQELDANLSGESVLNYYGEPSLGSIILTGASTIQEMP